MVGLTFDVFSTLLMKDERKFSLKYGLAGVLSAYANNALFAFVMTYLVRYEFWITGGSTKMLEHILVSGSYTAVLAAVVVPLGFWIGIRNGVLVKQRPQWTYAAILARMKWIIKQVEKST
jgi:hypothetical protein